MIIRHFDERVAELLERPVYIYLSASGAGAGIQQLLWDPAGASAYFAGAMFPYNQVESSEFVGFQPSGYVDHEMAIDLAIASYLRAAAGAKSRQPIGLGMTCAVATRTQHRGDHRVHAVVITRQCVLSADVILPKQGPAGRRSDGEIADKIGIELLLAASGVVPPEMRASHLYIGNFMRDITQEAREHFMKRPLFTRYGKREVMPDGVARLYPGNFDPPHPGHWTNAGEDTLYQITTNPPHKDPLSLTDMLERLPHFKGKRDLLFMEGGALYIEKARRFPGSTIVLGSDALVRMLDPKWGVETIPLLQEFRKLGTRFEVSCRNDDEYSQLPIPPEFWGLFREIPRTQFAHLSSTQIREAQRLQQ